MNGQLVLAHFNASDMRCHELPIDLISLIAKPFRERFDDRCLKLGGRHAGDRAAWRARAPQMQLRYIIAISHAVHGRMGRDHGMFASSNNSPYNKATDLERATVRCDH